jgi:hypothetical protein
MGSTVSMQLHQNPNDIPYSKIEKNHLKIPMEAQKTPSRQSNPEQKEQCCF